MSNGGCGLNSAQTIEYSLNTAVQGVEVLHVHIGVDAANMAFQVICITTTGEPTLGTLRKVYTERHGKQAYPLVVNALHGQQSTVFGPNPEASPWPLDRGQAERVLQDALDQPSGFQAQQKISQHRKAFQTASNLGVANAGLFANYFLQTGITKRNDWHEHCARSKPLLKLRGSDLIHILGFSEQYTAADVLLLANSNSGHRRAVAILLNEDEQFEAHSHKFNLTPIAFGLAAAAKNEVPWLLVMRGGEIRLYPARDGVGVGQRSQAETYFELNLSVLPEDQVGLLHLVFSADALEEGGAVNELLKASARFATDLGSRLRARIYEHVVPELAKGVAAQLPQLGLVVNADNLSLAYKLTLKILFRLLFQAYAEDKGLLPYERNERFTANALKTLVIRDLIPNAEGTFDANSTALWDDLAQVWKVIDGGDSAWNIPAYNGGLFGRDPERHPEGILISRMALPNNILGPALKHMLVDATEEGTLGPVDFGSLSVREFGTIYEGLLESSLSLADSDLALDKNGAWVPAQEGDTIEAAQGTPYFHNSSGERKATGSYFTPSIIVEHLLDRALEPALENHLTKVKELVLSGKESAAADLFFDFRVADLAMGSAHFLVAAVDRIETSFRNFLVETPIPKIRAELKRLGDAAREALGSDAEFVGDIDDALLLRRQIARRCIYGIDINEMAVELARLALWIHTFVPGLPMSSLDHGLVCANSLTGIGTIQEAMDALDPDSGGEVSLFSGWIEESLVEPGNLLREVAAADEANKQEIYAARELSVKAKIAAEPTKLIFDAAVAARLKLIDPRNLYSSDEIIAAGSSKLVSNEMELIKPAHMPYLYPEVFLRDNPGFDVLLGNPPWEKLTLEENKYWSRYSLVTGEINETTMVGLRDQRPDLFENFKAELNEVSHARAALMAVGYVGMGTGDPDLYKGFAWRNIDSIRDGGTMGLVLPLSAWNAKGSTEWRVAMLSRTTVALDLFRNRNEWLFAGVNVGYRVTTLAAQKGTSNGITIRGEFSKESEFVAGKSEEIEALNLIDLVQNDPEACIPAVSSPQEMQLWKKLRVVPGLGDGRLVDRGDFRCAPVTELHTVGDAKKNQLFVPDGGTPVYNHLNVGNLRFEAEKGVFAFADPIKTEHYLDLQRARSAKQASSAYSLRPLKWNEDPSTAPFRNARIAFREVVHASNPRKAWFCLVPIGKFLTHKAPFLVFADDDLQRQAYALGVLASSTIDWFSHLRVNLGMSFFILYTLPVPLYDGSWVANEIASTAGKLALVKGENYGNWDKFGPAIEDDGKRDELESYLDALVARLLGLTEDELRVVHNPENPSRKPIEKILEALRVVDKIAR